MDRRERNGIKLRQTQLKTLGEKLMLSKPLLLKGNVNHTVDSMKHLGNIISKIFTRDNQVRNKLVAARKIYQFLKRTVPFNVGSSKKLTYYRLCVQSILLFRSQVWYPSSIHRRMLKRFNEKNLFWVTELQNYSQ